MSLNIDWDAGDNQPFLGPALAQSNQAAIEAARQNYQAGGALSALHDIDFTNPQSVQQGINSLVKYGAVQQAQAATDLQKSRIVNDFNYARLPAIQGALAKYGQGGMVQVDDQGNPVTQQSSAQPTQAPSSTSPQSQADASSDGAGAPFKNANGPDPAHMQETLDQASQAIAQLQATPPEEIPAASAGIKMQFAERGVPPDAIQSIMPQPPPPNAQPDAWNKFKAQLAETNDYIKALKDHPSMGGQAPQPPSADDDEGAPAPPDAPDNTVAPVVVTAKRKPPATPPPMPTPPAHYVPWYQALANDPIALSGLNAGDSFGFTTGLGKAATELARPEITQEAEVRNAAAKSQQEQYGKDVETTASPVKSTYYVREPGQADYTPVPMTYAMAEARRQGGQEVLSDLPPEAKAKAEAAGGLEAQIQYGGEAARQKGLGEASTDVMKVDMPDGSTQQMTRLEYMAGVRKGLFGPAAGHSLSPQQQTYNAGDTKNLTDAQAASRDAATKAENDRDLATRGLALLGNIRTDAFTPTAKPIADALNVVGIRPQDATNLNMYKQALAQGVMGESSQFKGRFTDKDLKLAESAMGGLSSPTDAAKFLLATRAAMENREIEYQTNINAYKGLSKREYDDNFLNSVSNKSIYGDPIFQNLKINGRPAVLTTPVQPDGRQFGILFPGTKGEKQFRIR